MVNAYALIYCWFVCLMVFNSTFNNTSVISWQSFLLVEENGVPRENHRPVQVTDKLYHIMLYTSPWSIFEFTTLVVIGTDCIGSCKSNYHMITATMVPKCICIYYYYYIKLDQCLDIKLSLYRFLLFCVQWTTCVLMKFWIKTGDMRYIRISIAGECSL